jgi:hypothetical protein
MPDSLYSLSDLPIFLILVGVTITISAIAVVINKHFIFHKLRYKDNTTIGSISALIGIIYGVLVGFIALYLINNQDHASNAVLREANAAANIYRASAWLTQPVQSKVQEDLQVYLSTVIQKEWPLMRKFKVVAVGEGDTLVTHMFDDLRAFVPTTSSEAVILQNLLTQINALYDARHERITISSSQLSPELWEVILVGTILIIAINYAFRVNFTLHLFAVSSFSIMAASMLFLLVTLDRPFQGEFVVQPDALQNVLNLETGKS